MIATHHREQVLPFAPKALNSNRHKLRAIGHRGQVLPFALTPINPPK